MKFINVLQNKDVYADGIHDDTKALQACIDAVKDGGTVYFPDGTYLLSYSLIFYSNQQLRFSDKAVLLRSNKSDPITRYLLAAYSEPDWAGYDGTHDVIISGATFDGNADENEKSTLLNTVHCKNIIIENCRFFNCSQWHFIEINGTADTVIRNCYFDGTTYTTVNDGLFNEMVQLDLSHNGSYGPIYNCDGTLVDFCKDDAVCSNITIENNIFKCAGFPAIGHHGDCTHNNITIRNNIFDGPSGVDGKSRGYIIFRPQVYNIHVSDNVFVAPEKAENPNIGIIAENESNTAALVENNIFFGDYSEYFVGGITEQNNSKE